MAGGLFESFVTGLPSAIPAAGHRTRSGLETRTSRTPDGPGDGRPSAAGTTAGRWRLSEVVLLSEIIRRDGLGLAKRARFAGASSQGAA